jgi:hypothetical protein
VEQNDFRVTGPSGFAIEDVEPLDLEALHSDGGLRDIGRVVHRFLLLR